MQVARLVGLTALVLLCACQPVPASTVTILDGDHVQTLVTGERIPQLLLAQAGVILSPADRVLVNGIPVSLGENLPAGSSPTLQVLRAVPLTINGKASKTTALTVGEALAEAGIQLYAADVVDPPTDAPITPGIAIKYAAARELTVTVDGTQRHVRSAAATIGAALAEAGIPLVGLDFSRPPEDQPLPEDGQIRVTRVSESLVLAQKSIPYQSDFQESSTVELGQEQILQPGLSGLAVARTRIRYEDGAEVSRQSESETVVRPPQDRVVARGSKIVVHTTSVNGTTIQYWRMMQMYATVYSPCNSASSAGGGCSSGTASGLPAGKGVVAMDPSLYSYLSGQRLYIPGYGFAVVGDVGGGYIVERNTGISRYKWIDLGFDDNNLQDMTGWVTVYFLAPPPASIPDALK